MVPKPQGRKTGGSGGDRRALHRETLPGPGSTPTSVHGRSTAEKTDINPTDTGLDFNSGPLRTLLYRLLEAAGERLRTASYCPRPQWRQFRVDRTDDPPSPQDKSPECVSPHSLPANSPVRQVQPPSRGHWVRGTRCKIAPSVPGICYSRFRKWRCFVCPRDLPPQDRCHLLWGQDPEKQPPDPQPWCACPCQPLE